MKNFLFLVFTILPILLLVCHAAMACLGIMLLPVVLIAGVLAWYFTVFKNRNKMSEKAKTVTVVSLWAAFIIEVAAFYALFLLG